MEVKDLCNENYKTVPKELKKTQMETHSVLMDQNGLENLELLKYLQSDPQSQHNQNSTKFFAKAKSYPKIHVDLFVVAAPHSLQDLSSPDQGSDLGPPHKHGVLATGLLGIPTWNLKEN